MLKLYLIGAFVAGNGLDALTTWLGVFRLPTELRSKEMNPLFGDVSKHWKRAMVMKAVGTAVFCGVMLFLDVFTCLIVVVLMGLVVMNNVYIYSAKRILKRKVATLGLYCVQACRRMRLPEQVAYLMVGVLLLGTAYGIARLIK